MRIDALCKKLALHEVFSSYGVEPGNGLLFSDIAHGWDQTGLRQRDLDDAITLAMDDGEVAEVYTHEGRLAVLTENGHEVAQGNPRTLREIDQLSHALAGLAWAKRRKRGGLRSGRRTSDRVERAGAMRAR